MDRPGITILATLYGSPVDKPHAKNVMIRCPKCVGGTSPTLSVLVDDLEPSRAHCFKCESGGTLLTMFIEARDNGAPGLEDAVAFIEKVDRGGFSGAMARARELRQKGQGPAANAKWEGGAGLERYIFKCARQVPQYLVERGIIRSDVEKWRLGFDPDGKLAMRATFPVWDERKTLVGVTGRTVLDEKIDPPKYKDWPPDFAQRKATYFYGEHLIDPTLEHVVIVEGPISCIFASRVVPNALALFGAKTPITPERLGKLRRWAKAVTLLLDADGPGREAVHGKLDPEGKWHPGLRERLRQNFIVRVAELPDEQDPASVPGEVVVRAVRNARYLL
jgi:hypothetical protein